jgi:DNA-binding NarL/FixJ family response regulator
LHPKEAFLAAVLGLRGKLNSLQNRHYEEEIMTNDLRIRVLSVDDHPLLREGLAAIINSQPDMTMVGSASNGREAIEAFRVLKPEVVLLDLQLPDLNGIEVLIAIRNEFSEARVIILTTFERDVEIQRALKAGARGYLLKSMPPQQMLDAIRQVRSGKKSVAPELAAGLAEHLADETLSDREVEVLRHVADGSRNREIAKRLFIAEETVKVHLRHIMDKLGANDRTESVTIAARRGIIYL